MTQAPPLAPIGSVALWRVNRNIVVSGPEEKRKKRKKRLFGGTWCAATLWNRTVAWSVAGRRVAAAARVGVYIENNRGGCFDARCSAAVSKTHRQCRKWEYGSTWTSLDHLGIRGYSPGSFGNLVGENCYSTGSFHIHSDVHVDQWAKKKKTTWFDDQSTTGKTWRIRFDYVNS